MRQQQDARRILVDKQKLIDQIKANKQAHQKQYLEAVEMYKKEAKEKLDEAAKDLADGKMGLYISLTTPEDKSDEYDKLVQMFDWELEPQIHLSQGEFNEYVLDETGFAISARASNTAYMAKWKGK